MATTAKKTPKNWLADLTGDQRRRIILTTFGIIIGALLLWRVVTVLSTTSYPTAFWGFQIINGLILGGVYALVALGYTMVYGILLMINFAHGEVLMIGGFAGFFTMQAFNQAGWLTGSIPQSIVALIFIMLAGMLASVVTGVLLERIAYRPLRQAPRLIPLISAIGASFFLQYSALLIFGVTPHNYRKPTVIDGGFTLGETGIFLSFSGLFIFVTSILMMVGLYLIVQRTKLGRGMRAVAEDKEIAALMGVNVDQVIFFTFVLGSALAGAGGVMLGIHNSVMRFNTGFLPGLKAFTAAVIGGIGNIPGAMFGALLLGLLESLGPVLLGLPNEYKDVIAFALLILLLIFRPTGIFGERLTKMKA